MALGSASMTMGDAALLRGSSALASKQPPAEGDDLRKVARQFEALFVKQMLSQVNVSGALGETDNAQSDFVNSMWRDQVSTHMTQGAGLGLADMLVRQLGGASDKSAINRPVADGGLLRGHMPAVRPLIDMQAPVTPMYAVQSADDAQVLADSPQNFVNRLRPHLEKAAAELGVSPKVLLAQAALETGWGKHMPSDGRGQSSHNVFGIKADPGWSGAAVQAPTKEFVDGQLTQVNDGFRAYNTVAQSVQDYVDFLKRNPRYQQALNHGGSEENFLQGLKSAGYATDPQYVNKIIDVARGPTLERYWNAL